MSIIKALQAQFNALTVPLPIIDMCDGNLYDALILSQIVYWHDGRLRVKKGGKLWLVKAYDEWEAETRVNTRTARASIDRLKAKGIIETANHRFNGLKKVHIHLNEDVFNDLFTKAIESRYDIKSQTDVTPDVRPHVTPDVRPLTDTTTETTNKGAYSKLIVDEYVRRGMPLDAMVRMVVDETVRDISSALDRKGLPNPYHMSIEDLKAMIAWLQEPAQSWVDFSASTFTSKAIRAKFATRKVETPEAERRYKKLG